MAKLSLCYATNNDINHRAVDICQMAKELNEMEIRLIGFAFADFCQSI